MARTVRLALVQGAQLICFPEMAFDLFFPQYRADSRYFGEPDLLLVDLESIEQARRQTPQLRDRRPDQYRIIGEL